LPAARGLERFHDRAERRIFQVGADLANQQQIGERIIAVAVGAKHGADEAPLLQVSEVILAQPSIHAEKIPLRVILLPEFFRRLDSRHPAEVVLGDDAQSELFGSSQFVALLRAGRSFRPDNDHRRPGAYFVSGRTAEAEDKCLRLSSAKR
jgi:hypothetical protein